MAGPEGEIKAKRPGRAQQGQAGRTGNSKQAHSCCARQWAGGPARRELCQRPSAAAAANDCGTDVSRAHPRRREGEGRGAPPRQGLASLPGTGWSRTSRLEETKQSHGQGWPGSPPALASRGSTRQPGGARGPPVGRTSAGSRRQMDTRSGCGTSGVQSPRCAGGTSLPPQTRLQAALRSGAGQARGGRSAPPLAATELSTDAGEPRLSQPGRQGELHLTPAPGHCHGLDGHQQPPPTPGDTSPHPAGDSSTGTGAREASSFPCRPPGTGHLFSLLHPPETGVCGPSGGKSETARGLGPPGPGTCTQASHGHARGGLAPLRGPSRWRARLSPHDDSTRPRMRP